MDPDSFPDLTAEAIGQLWAAHNGLDGVLERARRAPGVPAFRFPGALTAPPGPGGRAAAPAAPRLTAPASGAARDRGWAR